jgi:NAD(P) transhydrogenase
VHDFELLVIGSGPGGQKAAIAAAKLDRRVAVVERPDMLGGVCLNTGTIPSKTLGEPAAPAEAADVPQPIGIYGIPEISFVGRTEDQLTEACVPFEEGVSRYRELARGQIAGDSYGVLKLLVSPEDRKLPGVHVFGTGATELIHIGQAVMGCGGTVDYLVDAVFNYPTLAESYKVAALDATNKMRQVNRMSG